MHRAVSNIDGRRAEAYQKKDQRMIIAAVVETVGFTELNAMITSSMREWLIEQVTRAMVGHASHGWSREPWWVTAGMLW